MPKYLEIVEWIKQQIECKELVPGQKMYSENELSAMFGLSRQTVRHAIEVLEKEEIIDRVQGSGTYIRNNRLQNLKNRTRISVITTYVDSYIFPRTIQGIEKVFSEAGYSVQISFTKNQMERETEILQDIIDRDEVAGIIAEPTKSGIPSMNIGLYEEIQKKKIPLLFINSYYPWIKAPHVSLNDELAGYKATKYLLEKGHRMIGGIFKSDDRQGQLRYKGYCEAMKEERLSYDTNKIIWIDTDDVKNLENCREKILNRFKHCTAIVCYNDEVSFSIIDILGKAGIQVPQELSIISVDDSELAVLGEVKLTSLPHPMEKLGEKAAENLLKMIAEPKYDGMYEFDMDIHERSSVLPMSLMSRIYLAK